MDDISFMYPDDAIKFEHAVTGCCRRCRALSIRIFIAQSCMEEESWKDPRWKENHPKIPAIRHGLGAWKIGEISPSSFRHDCILCQQFHLAFSLFFTASTGYRLQLDENLTSHALEVVPGVEDRYFNFHLDSESPGVRLLPLRSRWHNSRPTPISIGKEIRSQLPDLEQIKNAVRHCRSVHRRICKRPVFHDTVFSAQGLCVIDCVARRLVNVSPDVPYLCLSYVWGSAVVEEPGPDGTLPELLPKTIEDALVVAVRLDVPFLWVDCYCIDQKNVQEKHNLIRAMDKIYVGAELTIIAAVGDDPHYGLPGIRGTPRRPQYKIKMVGATYVAAEEVSQEITGSKWWSRGWTYQEMLLSRRRLVFTTSQLYYQCWELNHVESISKNAADHFSNTYRVFPNRGVGSTLQDLRLRMSEYFRRQLSFESDIIDAFLGIINTFRISESPSIRVKQFYGILVLSGDEDILDTAKPSFLTGLRWSVEPDGPNNTSCSEVFPSWTWASAKAGGSAKIFGELHPQMYIPSSSSRRYEGIVVILARRGEEGQAHNCSITEYSSYGDDYKDFWPWFDITTWTQQCDVQRISSDAGRVDIHGETETIYDSLALQLGQVHAVCTETTGYTWSHTPMIRIKGLLVVEVVPGEYRRVGLFYTQVDSRKCRSSDKAREELDQAFRPQWNWRENRERISANEGIAPFVLENFPGKLWQRRTIRLV
ncbi:heterokaryon incompatibility protein-domain-containing protein [Paraphoma chrysanthemicola]|nr:heterokaryon incompatibility protein-domain-containing protein [Paraphoma chrysanthemicola]